MKLVLFLVLMLGMLAYLSGATNPQDDSDADQRPIRPKRGSEGYCRKFYNSCGYSSDICKSAFATCLGNAWSV